VLTNYSEDSAPSIRIKVFNGSHSFEPSGVMAVPPHSTVLMDCMYPRVRGTPEWSWTSWYMQYSTGEWVFKSLELADFDRSSMLSYQLSLAMSPYGTFLPDVSLYLCISNVHNVFKSGPYTIFLNDL